MDKYLSGTVKFILGNATSNFTSSEFPKEAMELCTNEPNIHVYQYKQHNKTGTKQKGTIKKW